MYRRALFSSVLAFALCNSANTYSSAAEHVVGGKTASEVFSDASVARLARAACEGRADEMRRLLSGGVDADAQGFEGMTPLLWAENCGSVEGVRALLESGANPNGVTPSLNPVLAAIDSGNPEILRLLLDHGGNPNATLPESSWTALRLALSSAIEDGDWTDYETLLNSGADINRRYGGDTVAEFAAVLNVWDKVADLLERGYNRNLERFGGFAERADPALMSQEQLHWRARVRNQLERRGVRFPVPSSAMATPPDDVD